MLAQIMELSWDVKMTVIGNSRSGYRAALVFLLSLLLLLLLVHTPLMKNYTSRCSDCFIHAEK